MMIFGTNGWPMFCRVCGKPGVFLLHEAIGGAVPGAYCDEHNPIRLNITLTYATDGGVWTYYPTVRYESTTNGSGS